jgi:preprotein translocase subunit SecG
MTSLFIFLTVVQALIGAGLVGLILMQKSEGGGLGVGGSPTGLMSARGAADFMTRATVVLATLFVALSIALAALAVKASSAQKVDTSLVRPAPVAAPAAPAPAPATPADPLAGAAKK